MRFIVSHWQISRKSTFSVTWYVGSTVVLRVTITIRISFNKLAWDDIIPRKSLLSYILIHADIFIIYHTVLSYRSTSDDDKLVSFFIYNLTCLPFHGHLHWLYWLWLNLTSPSANSTILTKNHVLHRHSPNPNMFSIQLAKGRK